MGALKSRLLMVVTLFSLVWVSSAPAQQHDAAFFAQLQVGAPVDGKAGCTWQWARDTVGPWGGWYQSCTAPGLVPAASAPSTTDCAQRVNPYTPEGAEIMTRCAALGVSPPTAEPVPMRVGARYEQPYSDLQMIVLAIVAETAGREVVVCQWIGESARQRRTTIFILADEERGTWRARP